VQTCAKDGVYLAGSTVDNYKQCCSSLSHLVTDSMQLLPTIKEKAI